MHSVLVLLVVCILTFASGAPSGETAPQIISRYVVAHTGWKRSVFRIEKASASHGIVKYEVIYIAEEKLVVIGGGKSFALEYDPAKRRVIREWRNQ